MYTTGLPMGLWPRPRGKLCIQLGCLWSYGLVKEVDCAYHWVALQYCGLSQEVYRAFHCGLCGLAQEVYCAYHWIALFSCGLAQVVDCACHWVPSLIILWPSPRVRLSMSFRCLLVLRSRSRGSLCIPLGCLVLWPEPNRYIVHVIWLPYGLGVYIQHTIWLPYGPVIQSKKYIVHIIWLPYSSLV